MGRAAGKGECPDEEILLRQRAFQCPVRGAPDLDLAFGAAGREQLAVRRDGQRPHAGVPKRLRLAGQRDFRLRRHVPEPHAVVGGDGDQPCAAVGKTDARDVEGIGIEFRIRRPAALGRLVFAPQIDEAVLSARRQEGPVRREGQAVGGVFGTFEDRLDPAGRKIEQAHLAVGRLVAEARTEIAGRRHGLAVGRHRDGKVLAVVAFADFAAQDLQRHTALPVPDADGLVVGGRNEQLAVRREVEVLDEGAVSAGVEVEEEGGGIVASPEEPVLPRRRSRARPAARGPAP